MTPFGICMALTAQPLATATGMHRSQHLTKTPYLTLVRKQVMRMPSGARTAGSAQKWAAQAACMGSRSSLSSREVELAARPPLSRTSKGSQQQQPARHAPSASVCILPDTPWTFLQG